VQATARPLSGDDLRYQPSEARPRRFLSGYRPKMSSRMEAEGVGVRETRAVSQSEAYPEGEMENPHTYLPPTKVPGSFGVPNWEHCSS
jgi:hypothetical protein